MTLKQIQKKFREIASKLGSSREIATVPQHDGSPHAETQGNTYFYVLTEKGSEYERRQTNDPDELLYWFISDLTWEFAAQWEVTNRIRRQDFRRLLFTKHLEILNGINPSWVDRKKCEYEEVLKENPFADDLDD